eukprot:UN02014
MFKSRQYQERFGKKDKKDALKKGNNDSADNDDEQPDVNPSQQVYVGGAFYQPFDAQGEQTGVELGDLRRRKDEQEEESGITY